MKQVFQKPVKPVCGSKVQVISPASCPKNTDRLNRGIDYLSSLGFQVQKGRHLLDKDAYLAGADSDRFADLKEAFDSDSAAILCSRGGYGCMRLLPYLNQLQKPAFKSVLSYLLSAWNLRHRVWQMPDIQPVL